MTWESKKDLRTRVARTEAHVFQLEQAAVRNGFIVVDHRSSYGGQPYKTLVYKGTEREDSPIAIEKQRITEELVAQFDQGVAEIVCALDLAPYVKDDPKDADKVIVKVRKFLADVNTVLTARHAAHEAVKADEAYDRAAARLRG